MTRRVPRLLRPEPVGRGRERRAGLGELERAHDPAAVVRDGRRAAAAGSSPRAARGPPGRVLVVERRPALARARLGRRRQRRARRGPRGGRGPSRRRRPESSRRRGSRRSPHGPGAHIRRPRPRGRAARSPTSRAGWRLIREDRQAVGRPASRRPRRARRESARATASATLDLPLAVGPKMPITVTSAFSRPLHPDGKDRVDRHSPVKAIWNERARNRSSSSSRAPSSRSARSSRSPGSPASATSPRGSGRSIRSGSRRARRARRSPTSATSSAYREVARVERGLRDAARATCSRRSRRASAPFVARGGFAVDVHAFRQAGLSDREVRVRVLGLGALEYALLAPGRVHRRDRCCSPTAHTPSLGADAAVGDRRAARLRRCALGGRAARQRSARTRDGGGTSRQALDSIHVLKMPVPDAAPARPARHRRLLVRRHRLPVGVPAGVHARHAGHRAAPARLRDGLRADAAHAAARRRRRGRGAAAVRALVVRDLARRRRARGVRLSRVQLWLPIVPAALGLRIALRAAVSRPDEQRDALRAAERRRRRALDQHVDEVARLPRRRRS